MNVRCIFRISIYPKNADKCVGQRHTLISLRGIVRDRERPFHFRFGLVTRGRSFSDMSGKAAEACVGANISYIQGAKRNLAYVSTHGRSPGIVFCCGYGSNMSGTKAMALEEYCRKTNRAFVRFDYTGLGQSDGKFDEQTLGQWKEDTLTVLDTVTTGPQVLVGSSMGGWLMLLVARERPERIQALVGIASAPDYTKWRNYSDEVKQDLQKHGVAHYETEYGPMSVSQVFIEESSNHWLLHEILPIWCPVRLLHGMKDTHVPYDLSMQLAEKIQSDDIDVILRKTGDHRLSTAADISLLTETLDKLFSQCPPTNVKL